MADILPEITHEDKEKLEKLGVYTLVEYSISPNLMLEYVSFLKNRIFHDWVKYAILLFDLFYFRLSFCQNIIKLRN